MAADDELVPTSDPEEFEELAANQPGYWITTANTATTKRRAALQHRIARASTSNGDVEKSPGSPLSLHPRTISRSRDLLSPPRKRLKLDEAVPLIPSPGTPLIPRTNLPTSPHLSVTLKHHAGGHAKMTHSPISSVLVPSPARLGTDIHRSPTSSFEPASEGVPALSQQSSFTRGTSIGSPQSSPDPLLLFTPQRRKSSPGAPVVVASSPPTSSPLPTVSSPTKHAIDNIHPSPEPSRRHSYSPALSDDVPLVPVRTDFTRSPPREPRPPLAAVELAQANERSRYSLRNRNDRQIHPYEFDKRMYKFLMRANPEAIIKVVSPPRAHRRHRSTSAGAGDGSSDNDHEYHARIEDEDDDAASAKRRRKGKERESRPEDDGASVREEVEGQTTKSIWLPDAMRDISSSSDEDEDLLAGLTLGKKVEKVKVRRHRKHRPFPMKKHDFQQPGSPHKPLSPLGETLPTRPRPRPLARLSEPVALDEEETQVPGPVWRRRRGVNVSSPTRTSQPPTIALEEDTQEPGPSWRGHRRAPISSPNHKPHSPPADDSFAVWDNVFDAYDDGFFRTQSPVTLALSPHAKEDDPILIPSSEIYDPPRTPSEVIDVTSDSEFGDEDGDEGDGTSMHSSKSTDEEDRKRMNILRRMMPQVMIKQLQSRARAKKIARASASVERDDEDLVDKPLRPGESRRRLADRTLSTRSIEIRGDSESSDVDIPMSRDPSPTHGQVPLLESSEIDLTSGEESVIAPIGHQLRPTAQHDTHHPLSEDDWGDGSDVSNVDDAVDRWVSGAKNRRPRPDTEAKEGDLIDRMLARTNVTNRSRVRRKRRKNAARREDGGATSSGHRPRDGGGRQQHEFARRSGGGGGGSKGGRLHITTGGAKRLGVGRQTLLSFQRLPAADSPPDAVVHHSPSPPPNVVHFTGDEPAKAKQKAMKNKAKPAGLYTFAADHRHLTSGRSKPVHVTVDQEVSAPRAPAALRDDQHARWPKFRYRAPAQGPQTSTLEDYWEPGDDHYEHDGFVVPNGAVPQPSSQQPREWEHVHRATVDLDVHPLPAGVAFPNTTYLGRGWLHELINLLPGTHDIPSPPSCSMFDCYLHAEMSATDFTICLESIFDQLRNLIPGTANYETCQTWQGFLHMVSQHMSVLLIKTQEAGSVALAADVESFVRRLGSLLEDTVEISPDDQTLNPLVLQVLWSLLEVTCRLAVDRRRRAEEPDRQAVVSSVQTLMMKLWDFSFGKAALPFDLTREGLTQATITQQMAELWVCLLSLSGHETFQASFLPQGTTFWISYVEVLRVKGLKAPQTDLRVREAVWRSIFSLSALSQFSIHGNSSMTPRIPPSWNVVTSILECSPLSADPVADAALPKSSLRKRDRYVRILVSRCLWLHLKWHWRLDVDDAVSMFNRLLDVFKSRRFASLQDEPSDLPSFLRQNNLSLLQEKKGSDTAFTLFLKLVVQAAEDMRKENPQLAKSAAIPQKLKKILSLAVPVGSVPFKKASPPTSRDLSMLYNRFSAIAMAIYLEPVPSSVEYRLAKLVRRYVVFRDADNETRRACIRGAMHLAILLRHLDLPLKDILAWLTEMTDVLIDEYRSLSTGNGPTQGKDWVVVSIHLLLGCIRRILQTSSMDPENRHHKYPDPTLLQGPWVTRVFSTATDLSTISSTGDEIRRLVQAFLDARGHVIPRPRRPQLCAEEAEESESQDLYDNFELDLNDPVFLAAVQQDVGPSEHQENKMKDTIVCEIIDKHISPAIYRLICKHFNDPVYQEKGELSFQDADRWIDCWVGCASVVVQNGKKAWSFYLNYGPQSWEKIIEPDWRRRVGLRFMYMLLKLDPTAYFDKDNSDRFIDVLFECMATPTVTLEHDYASLLFSINRLRHPLLSNLPIDPPEARADYDLKKEEFVEKRPAMLEAMFKNLTDSLTAAQHDRHDTSLSERNQTYITSVIVLLSTIRDICNQFDTGTVNRALYVVFCRQILDLLSRCPPLSSHARLTTQMAWLRNVS